MQLVEGDGAAQIALQFDTLGYFITHGFVENGHLVPAGFLGLVHGGIGVADEGFRRGMGVVARREGQPHAGGDVELDAVEQERVFQAEAKPVRQVHRLRGGHHPIKQDHELIATDARHEVGRPDVGPQPAGHFDEQIVTSAVAERVVDELEPVQVQEQQGDVAVVG